MARAVADAAPEVDDKVEVTVVARRRRGGRGGRAERRGGRRLAAPGRRGLGAHLGVQRAGLADRRRRRRRAPAGAGRERAAAGTTAAALEAGSDVTTRLPARRRRAGGGRAGGRLRPRLPLLPGRADLRHAPRGSVVEEKQSRIVEIIATAIPLRHLLAGKVLGNTALAVIQMALYVAVGLVGLSSPRTSPTCPASPDALGLVPRLLPRRLRALACLWAVAGCAGQSRTEDLQATSTPLTMLMLAMFFGGVPRRHGAGRRARTSRRSRPC